MSLVIQVDLKMMRKIELMITLITKTSYVVVNKKIRNKITFYLWDCKKADPGQDYECHRVKPTEKKMIKMITSRPQITLVKLLKTH